MTRFDRVISELQRAHTEVDREREHFNTRLTRIAELHSPPTYEIGSGGSDPILCMACRNRYPCPTMEIIDG